MSENNPYEGTAASALTIAEDQVASAILYGSDSDVVGYDPAVAVDAINAAIDALQAARARLRGLAPALGYLVLIDPAEDTECDSCQ